jgi:electron transfer flavoprotein-quinone oxidoreductase
MLPLVETMKKIEGLKVDYLMADLGYFDAEDQKTALLKHDVAVVTEIKKNTIVPDHCSPEGKPECEQGHALVFDGFDKDTYMAWFRGDDAKCSACPMQIEDRFGLEGDEGVTIEFMGETSLGMAGMGFLYTNKETISLGVGVMVNHLRDKKVKRYALLDSVKQHPMIRKLIQGGETKEYSGHLIPEGGYNSIPPLSGNGWCVAGDAAQLVNFVHREGTNLAMTSERMVGEAIVEAKQAGEDCSSAASLKRYDNKMRESFVHKDLKKYKGMHELLKQENPELLFDKLPRALNAAAFQFLTVDGVSKAEKQRAGIRMLKDAAGGTMNLLKLGYKGWRAMNG